jgi:hypothetical protein
VLVEPPAPDVEDPLDPPVVDAAVVEPVDELVALVVAPPLEVEVAPVEVEVEPEVVPVVVELEPPAPPVPESRRCVSPESDAHADIETNPSAPRPRRRESIAIPFMAGSARHCAVKIARSSEFTRSS